MSGTASCHCFTARDGQTRAQMEINASQIEFMSSYGGNAETAAQAQQADNGAQANGAQAYNSAQANGAANAYGAYSGSGFDYSGFKQVDEKLPF